MYRYMCVYIFIMAALSVISKAWGGEGNQMSISTGTDKSSVVHARKGLMHSKEEEQLRATHSVGESLTKC